MAISKIYEDLPAKTDVSTTVVHTGGEVVKSNDGFGVGRIGGIEQSRVDPVSKEENERLDKEHAEFVKTRKKAYESDKKAAEAAKKHAEDIRKNPTPKKMANPLTVDSEGRVASDHLNPATLDDPAFLADVRQSTPRPDVADAAKQAEPAKPAEPVKPAEVKK